MWQGIQQHFAASWCLIWPHQLTTMIMMMMMMMISHWHFLSSRYTLTKRLEHVNVSEKVWMHNQIHSSHLKTFNSRQLDFFIYCHKRPQDVCKFLFKVKKRQKVKESLSFRIAMCIYDFSLLLLSWILWRNVLLLLEKVGSSFKVWRHIKVCLAVDHLNQFCLTFLGNRPPTPPLSQHVLA